MTTFDIRAWVEQSKEHRAFREAVHTVLAAISGTPELRTGMIMKGGILLALSYESTRYTKDIDFSTPVRLADFNIESFMRRFEASLASAVDGLDYGLDCMVQKHEQQPPRDDATFPTIRISVGYADKSNASAHRRLRAKNAPHVVRIDYSLNEPAGAPVLFEVEDGVAIQTYSFEDLVGEKFRALLQQEVRNRFRRQDIYDLHFLLTDHPDRDSPFSRLKILNSLRERAAARNLQVGRGSMRNPDIRQRSRRDYESLSSEIEHDLHPFDTAYEAVMTWYEALPWDS